MNKLSIRVKISLLIVFSFVSLLLIGAAGWLGVQSAERSAAFVYKNNVVPMGLLQRVDENLKEIRYRMAGFSLQQLPAAGSSIQLKEARVAINQDWSDFKVSIVGDTLSAEQQKLLATTDKTLSEKLPKLLDELAKAYHSDNAETVMSLLEDDWPMIHAGSLKPISELLPSFQQAVASSFEQGERDINRTKQVLFILSLALLIGLGAFGLWISAQIVRSLRTMQVALHDIELTADFGKRVPVNSGDEVGQTARVLNELLAAQQAAIDEANQVVAAIARADFSLRMTGNYVGDLDALKQGVNASAQSVAFMMGELSKVMSGLQAGQFDVKMDKQVPEAFRQQVEQALATIGAVVNDINEVMHQMNDGEFSVRVNASAQGELLVMKNNVNDSLSALDAALADVLGVLQGQSEGDLTQQVTKRYHGQLGFLAAAINRSADKIKAIVSDAVQSAHVVNDAAGQVSRGSAELSSRVQEQAAALERTSSTMNQMTTAVQSNTRNAQQAARQADDVKAKAVQGAAVMQQTIDAMSAIRESSHKISDIVSLIDGIAFQTNLLALNAAVEAARAGEHGRGFAVVAGEVRSLAGKSADAAKDIKHLINDSVQRIETGTHLADQSGEMLQDINQAIGQVTDSIGQIATASGEQAQGIAQVHHAIHDIDQMTQENAALVEETTAAAESLGEQASVLQRNMSFFKVGNLSAARRDIKLLS
jgi:methyl-accepting chemotaxis protein